MKKWIINIDGNDNEVIFVPNKWSGKHKLTVNGEETEIKKTPFQAFTGIDQPITIGEKECRFVLVGNKADIAVDGMYADSKKPYTPLKNMPWWVWIFIAACIAVPIVSLGGALPVVIALLCSTWCVRISVAPDIKTVFKVFYCLGISVLAWVLLVVLMLAMSGLQ